MADLTEQQLLSTDPEVLGLQRQRALANLLTGQAFNAPQGQMISGHYVKPSALQQALPMINAAIGGSTNVRLDTEQQKIAEMLRGKGDEAVKDIMETYKTDPNSALQKATQYQQFPQVKALLPQLSKVALPEATTLEREFAAVKAQGYQGNINDFKNQMNKYQESQSADAKQRLGLEGARFGLEQQKFNLENAPYNPAAFGQQSAQATQQVMPQNALINVGSPAVKSAGLAPAAPAYAQGAMNFQVPQAPQLQPQANVSQALSAPPAWVRTQKDYKDWLKSESEPLTEFQGKAVLYGSGMLQANNVINKLSAEGTVTGAVTPAFLSGIAALAPLGVGDAAVNAINSAFRADPTGFVGPDKNQQKLAQAQLGFAIPYLRQTSGANFGAKEVADTIAEYFPLMGEDKEVAKQKEASRNRVIQGMKSVSGRGAKQIEELGNISAPSGWGKAQVVKN